MKKTGIALFTIIMLYGMVHASSYELLSPDSSLRVVVNCGDRISMNVEKNDEILISPILIGLEIGKLNKNGQISGKIMLGKGQKVLKINERSVNEKFNTPLYKRAEIENIYNEIELVFQDNFSIIIRAYNDGIAYRFVVKEKGTFVVTDEICNYSFPYDAICYAPYSNRGYDNDFDSQYFNSFENIYDVKPVTRLNPGKLMFLPVLMKYSSGSKVVITEADLRDYPGMFLNSSKNEPGFNAVFAPVVKDEMIGGHNNLQMVVNSQEDYIAKCVAREFPWRTVIVASEDKELLDSDMVYKLSSPSCIPDVSWIKPGKVSWDWWNDWNLKGVDFRTGMNTETYKFYIDFASENGIEYVILDEGWAVNKIYDLFSVVPEIDLEEIIRYSENKNVGIILWAGYWAYRRDMERVTKHYSDMGVKGFKIDFMDRDDQDIIRFLYESAEVCAKYKMIIDFHGVCKPAGLQRTWPNVLNFEGVFGLEQLKWASKEYDQVTYDVEMPFIRMVAGPIDYTQGAMRNAVRHNYYPSYSEPMSQGTRCRQLAEYVIFESPLNMLCDAPTNYMKEEECTKLIALMPVVWDQTVALDSKLSEYIIMARRSGDVWYIGGITNWDTRVCDLDLSFIGEGNYRVEVFKDGINADRNANDYKRENFNLSQNKMLRIKMAPGGGFIAKIIKI